MEYVLGTNDREVDRLAAQQRIWGPVTEAFLDRLGVAEGARVLDAGCGPGSTLGTLRRRIGPTGRLVGVDASPRFIADLEAEGVHAELVCGRLSEAPIEGPFDLIFSRWVFTFVPDPAAVVRRFASLLAPGGVLAIQDYNHYGVSAFPESAHFRAVIKATRDYIEREGGDSWIAGKLPAHFHAAGLELFDTKANILTGGPGSPVFEWLNAFLVPFSGVYREAGLLTDDQHADFLADWASRARDLGALYFSPNVVDLAARKPA